MVWALLTVMFLALLVGVRPARKVLRGRRETVLQEAETFRLNRRVAAEDITIFGEELTELHVETLTTALDQDMRADYQRALDAYEQAQKQLHDAASGDDVRVVLRTLESGRFAQARVLARRDHLPLPDRRPPCFFDPTHGPSGVDLTWTPPGGVEREIPVCHRDAERLRTGETPDSRIVQLGSRPVPWYAAGPTYHSYAEGYFGRYAEIGYLDVAVLTALSGDGDGGGGF